MEKPIRLIKAEKDEFRYSSTNELVETTFHVTDEWHCPIQVYDEIVVGPGDGMITMGVPSRPCLSFDKDGTLSEDESCEFCEGIVDLSHVDIRVKGERITNLYTKCSYANHQYCSSEIDEYCRSIKGYRK